MFPNCEQYLLLAGLALCCTEAMGICSSKALAEDVRRLRPPLDHGVGISLGQGCSQLPDAARNGAEKQFFGIVRQLAAVDIGVQGSSYAA